MQIRMPSAMLTALINGVTGGSLTSDQTITAAAGGGNVGGLRLVRALPGGGNQPAEFIGTNAAIAALINAGTQSIAVPAGYIPAWLELPVRWLPTVLGTSPSNCPQSGPLQLTSECALDAGGLWGPFLISLGFTAFTPSVFPLPVLTG